MNDETQGNESAGDETASGATEATQEVAAEEPQPTEFPVSFAEWKSLRPAYERVLLAGFEFEVRQAGLLTEMQMKAAWNEAFAAFQGAKS